jgi:hypothetical protein
MTETLEVYVLPDEFPEHPELADPTNSTVVIIAGVPHVNDVTFQFGSMVILFDALTTSRKGLFVRVPPCLQLLIGDFKCTGDGWTFPLGPLATEVRLNLTLLSRTQQSEAAHLRCSCIIYMKTMHTHNTIESCDIEEEFIS